MRRWCSLQEGRRTSASAVQAIVAGLGRQQRAAREISGERGAALLSFFSPGLYSSRAARGSVVKEVRVFFFWRSAGYSHGIDGEGHRPDIQFAITSCRGPGV
jgi:hypothetical protein